VEIAPKKDKKLTFAKSCNYVYVIVIFLKPYIQQNKNKLLSKPIGPHKKLDMDIVNNHMYRVKP
jgi:hypothetical protein